MLVFLSLSVSELQEGAEPCLLPLVLNKSLSDSLPVCSHRITQTVSLPSLSLRADCVFAWNISTAFKLPSMFPLRGEPFPKPAVTLLPPVPTIPPCIPFTVGLSPAQCNSVFLYDLVKQQASCF